MSTTTTTTTNFSFYIPRIHCHYTIDDIIYTFRLLYIGEVKRVDINAKLTDYMSVFVHMEYLYDSEIAWDVVNYTHKKNSYYKLWVEEDIYWLILKNNNPLEDTCLNIHQLAENTRILEEKVHNLETKLTEKDDKIARLNAVCFRLIYSVFPIVEQLSNKSISKSKSINKSINNSVNTENLKNIYDCINMLNYGKFYNKNYLSSDESIRNQQLLEQHKKDLNELKEAEPWDDMSKHYEVYMNNNVKPIIDMMTYFDSSYKDKDKNTYEDDTDSMPSLISCD